MQGEEELTIDDLASNLSTYKDQLRQVRQLLVDDPENAEYADMQKELEEVIALTEELLLTARQNEVSAQDTHTNATESLSLSYTKGHANDKVQLEGFPGLDEKLPIGSKVQAVYSEDGEWYEATIEAYTPNGYYVSYDGWGNKEEVDPDNVRVIGKSPVNPLLEAERVAEATKQAIKQKIAHAAAVDFQPKRLPEKLQIQPDDPEDVRAAKKKKIHAFKSKMRLEEREAAQNKKQNAWQQFQSTKGRTKKVGFFSGRKRESIFKSPDDPNGKVGVTGSGKGLTEFQKREKHLHLKGANAETIDD
ncbi:hypothetical protein SAY87_029982 [Trapa incisa]|uniref:Tudor domain-containing protein n=1 Tax=Trapa incisa TaxID=236973 RepID=A0AAN7KCQ7_9MYRT|nr:hypothetical protein SAY87_029982 [Trapa incisa]